MCGIFGYVGNNAYQKVIEGLNLLQYRGYDSCGVAYFEKSFKINKAVGKISNLKPITNNCVNIAFGHTRWATNGIVNIENAHPHVSFDTSITLVHNGIIKNSNKIKEDLKKKGIPFYSDTDTEVIANYIVSQGNDIEETIKHLFDVLEGTFSLIIGNKKGELYLVKKFSPLNLLVQKDEILVSSDISSLPSGDLYSLKDGDIIKISDNKITKLNDNNLNYSKHINSIKKLKLNIYKHYMEKEIYQTPDCILNTYKSLLNFNVDIFTKYKRFTFIGCGTAYHSCLIGEYLFKNKLNYFTETYLANNYSINNKISRNHLHIIVSQSGETADCIKVAEQISKNKGKFLLITNEEFSTLAKIADFKIITQAEKELAVASTKTYSCQLFVFAYLYNKIKDRNYNLDITNFITILNNYLKQINIDEVANVLQSTDKLILIGNGIDYLTILEASLKIREIDYIFTIPLYSGELKHGTLSLIDKNIYTIALKTNNSNIDLAINEIISREGKIIKFNDDAYAEIEEEYKPIFAIIPFQILSYRAACMQGKNPDTPRNLAKSVTVE